MTQEEISARIESDGRLEAYRQAVRREDTREQNRVFSMMSGAEREESIGSHFTEALTNHEISECIRAHYGATHAEILRELQKISRNRQAEKELAAAQPK